LFFTCISGFEFLLSLLIKHFDMDRQTEEQHVSVQIVRLARFHNIFPQYTSIQKLLGHLVHFKKFLILLLFS
jgi:hypothetical protein